MEQILTQQYLKVPEYAKKYGLPESRVRQMCLAKQLEAYRECEGGHWYIRDVPGEVVPRAQYDELIRENAMLKTKLQSIMALCAGK
jgi:hypothetical protein